MIRLLEITKKKIKTSFFLYLTDIEKKILGNFSAHLGNQPSV